MKLSVFMLAYNHEPYIAQAIESVLRQRVNFEYEIVVGEDCSTDGTRGILLDLQRQHPHKIRLLLRDQNVGMIRNAAQTLSACQGQYVALLEGDDYWTSPDKLQKQIDFLDAHPDYAICFHSVMVVDESKREAPWVFPQLTQPVTSRLEDLFEQDFIPTCSTVFRNKLFGELPEWFYELPMGDWSLHILNAQYGLIGYMSEVMGVYRHHSNSVWSSRALIPKLQGHIKAYTAYNRHFNYNYNRQIKQQISFTYYWLASEYLKIDERSMALKHLIKSAAASPRQPGVPYGLLLRLMLLSIWPSGLKHLRRSKQLLRGQLLRTGRPTRQP